MKLTFKLMTRVFWVYLFSGVFNQTLQADTEKPMVIVIPSYNNESWYKQNLDSVFGQKYTNYRVIYINDCSTDRTYQLVCDYINQNNFGDRVTIINNQKNLGALANLYNAIHSCLDQEIIISLDGDDGLAHERVLARVNEAYADSSTWLVYSQFVMWPANQTGWNSFYSKNIIDSSPDRGYSPSHLRTFYAGLFKKIEREDLLHEGDFFSMSWDEAMMLPMMEMARNGHVKFIPDVLYIYNDANPISDHRKSKTLQRQLDLLIRGKKRYCAINNPF